MLGVFLKGFEIKGLQLTGSKPLTKGGLGFRVSAFQWLRMLL